MKGRQLNVHLLYRTGPPDTSIMPVLPPIIGASALAALSCAFVDQKGMAGREIGYVRHVCFRLKGQLHHVSNMVGTFACI